MHILIHECFGEIAICASYSKMIFLRQIHMVFLKLIILINITH